MNILLFSKCFFAFQKVLWTHFFVIKNCIIPLKTIDFIELFCYIYTIEILLIRKRYDHDNTINQQHH